MYIGLAISRVANKSTKSNTRSFSTNSCSDQISNNDNNTRHIHYTKSGTPSRAGTTKPVYIQKCYPTRQNPFSKIIYWAHELHFPSSSNLINIVQRCRNGYTLFSTWIQYKDYWLRISEGMSSPVLVMRFHHAI